ncbi:hypothetical protein B0T17DRAFT_488719 [Bombardia bombarda]|uniref:Uncharacterized protein n=1 Tax=Bombardia bombarda TaxID=252184 RepID=A0AA40C981_9PEZI|nr:hypothetical protein B0T17DRAFT_488719 [Bombardia bombarda]
MMRRSYQTGPGLRACQMCELIYRQQPAQSAKRPFVTLGAGRRLAKISPEISITPMLIPTPITTRLFSTSRSCLKVKQAQNPQSLNVTQRKFARPQQVLVSGEPEVIDLEELVVSLDRVTNALDRKGIPSEEMTLTALRACAQSVGKLMALTASPKDSADASSVSSPEASHLLDLGQDRKTHARKTRVRKQDHLRPEDVVNMIAQTADRFILHPDVVITPEVLAEYVRLQAILGKADTLPQTLALYALKPSPRLSKGTITYVERNPYGAQYAIDSTVADMALDVALKAKHLDAAIGIVEGTYATKAYRRSKAIQKVLLPAAMVGAAPIAVYFIASNLALMQTSFDQGTATTIATIGILGYLGFTGTIGLVAATTANDQMKRVTWARGTPLRERWVREEERAAFDKVACAFGFAEEHRYGEEDGEEFQQLQEFILRRGMVLDAVDLMPGMN